MNLPSKIPPYFTFKTAAEAKHTEEKLLLNGIPFRTRIIKTRKRGLEYRIDLLNS